MILFPRVLSLGLPRVSPALLITALSVVVSLAVRAADPIPPSYRVDWIPGVTVGSGTIVSRSANVIDVTKAPYNVSTNGLDASDAINRAVADGYTAYGGSNFVIYAPGHIVCSNELRITSDGITFRGTTNGSVWLGGGLKMGRDPSNYRLQKTGDDVVDGATKGSFTVTLSNAPTFGKGELVVFGGTIPATDMMQIIGLGTPVLEPKFYVYVTNVSGRTVMFTPSLPYDFTNAFMMRLSSTGFFRSCGLENLNLTGSNRFNGALSPSVSLVTVSCVFNGWMTNCSLLYARNYSLYLHSSANFTMRQNTVAKSQGAGSNHAGLLTGASSSLVEDNIFADGLNPAIEFNGGVGNVFFANFFTNNLIDIDNHGPHPLMNLFEQNHLGTYEVVTAGPSTNWYGGGFELDGYFGSCSHQTLFRNAFTGQNTAVALKRWSSYCAIVGNVLGNGANGVYHAFSHDTNGVSNQLLELGRPNIGNVNYIGRNPPVPWNFPGHWIQPGVPNGMFVITNTQVNTNVIAGMFTNIPGYAGSLIFQDAVNTNLYWPQDGIAVLPTRAGTLTSITVDHNITVSNGWRVYFISQINGFCYQQLNTTNRDTHLITGNYDYYNKAQTWNSSGAQTLPASYLYRLGAPSWWGTNRWPAIQPDNSTLVTRIPAQSRYLGIPTGSAQGPSRPATPRLTDQ